MLSGDAQLCPPLVRPNVGHKWLAGKQDVELRYPLGRFLLCYYGGGTTQREFDVRFGALKSKTYETTKIMV
jgi:hypothetical protein